MVQLENLRPTALALSADIPIGEVHPVVLQGRELALWRDSQKALHLWEDRCPHRGMRLSFGFVRGDRLTCLYHGWQYGTDGGCRHIPAHPQMEPPATLCTDIATVSETCGLVISAKMPPDPETWYPVRTLVVDAKLDHVAARLPFEGAGWTEQGPLMRGQLTGSAALALQPMGAETTALHLTTTDPDPAVRQALAADLAAYRHSLSMEHA